MDKLEFLCNGAVVIAKKPARDGFVVLAFWPGTAEPYVIWNTDAAGGITSSGTYRANIAGAAALFYERTTNVHCQWCGSDDTYFIDEEWVDSFTMVERRCCSGCDKDTEYVYSLVDVGQSSR
jgi:hypothetical protein